MREEQDRLFAMIHLAISEARLIGDDELDAILAWDVGGGDDCEFAPVDAAVKCDGANQPARNRAAHCGSVPHAVAVDIVHITRAAQQLVHAFLAGNVGANDAGCRRRAHGFRSRFHRTD